jgi:hypothetical protein
VHITNTVWAGPAGFNPLRGSYALVASAAAWLIVPQICPGTKRQPSYLLEKY